MIYDFDFGISGIKPSRYLIVGYNEDLMNPRRVLFNGSQAVFQFIIVGIASIAIYGRLFIGIPYACIAFCLPLWVVSIYPKIY